MWRGAQAMLPQCSSSLPGSWRPALTSGSMSTTHEPADQAQTLRDVGKRYASSSSPNQQHPTPAQLLDAHADAASRWVHIRKASTVC